MFFLMTAILPAARCYLMVVLISSLLKFQISQSHSRAAHQFSLTVPSSWFLLPALPSVVLSPPLTDLSMMPPGFCPLSVVWGWVHSCSHCSPSVLEGPGRRKTAFRMMTEDPDFSLAAHSPGVPSPAPSCLCIFTVESMVLVYLQL